MTQIESTDVPPPAYEPTSDALSVSLARSQDASDILITLTPPRAPPPGPNEKAGGKRAPVDICCVIDVSGSMASEALIPGGGEDAEATGLCVLDIVKHAIRTIAATMDENDRISIITFNDSASLVAGLTRMDEEGKESVVKAAEGLRPSGGTNLWAGLKMGMNVLEEAEAPSLPKGFSVSTPISVLASSVSRIAESFSSKKSRSSNPAPTTALAQPSEPGEKAQSSPPSRPAVKPVTTLPPLPTGRISSVFILTDGCPNIEPPRGHIPMLQSYLEKHPNRAFSINTFGFGYSLDSHLLYQIAVEGGGNFGFIPDSGFVGTVFVHAGANLFATYAKCTLDVQVTGAVEVLGSHTIRKNKSSIIIEVGDVQYGQTKDIVIRLQDAGVPPTFLVATARYKPWDFDASADPLIATAAITSTNETSALDDIAYHTHRLTFVSSILSIFPTRAAAWGHDETNTLIAEKAVKLKELSSTMRASLPNHSNALALADDIDGQVALALNDLAYFEKWGRHYLPFIARAHQRQQCGNFKDAGLLVYGKDSPLFQRVRDEMDSAFDTLPPPKPTTEPSGYSYRHGHLRQSSRGAAVQSRASMTMKSWNTSSAPCFAGHCRVLLALDDSSGMSPGDETVMIQDLQRGMQVSTPLGPRRVAALVRTAIYTLEAATPAVAMCKCGDLVVTPYHPVYDTKTACWVFPKDLVSPQDTHCDAVYSILLEPDRRSEAHAVMIEGIWCVTLGHGLVSPTSRDSELVSDVRAHAFFGDYEQVLSAVAALPGFETVEGMVKTGGVVRSRGTGLVVGFAKPQSVAPPPTNGASHGRRPNSCVGACIS
ncbi:hypothetical protein BOTBODRAFT_181289 [Botryobasidium botryosum FD-172 SS1]|uniref:VWFA domain-containing protein n=1 Tax=Botryobasidium botryosum (strain FD-172 SS1) TaxID=930990 RepID=A0A067M4I2_BOTB1|nr:hypothetical protein BOTBODRAFT_181289 [Botryobasidium botryosum FD-172 SS1]